LKGEVWLRGGAKGPNAKKANSLKRSGGKPKWLPSASKIIGEARGTKLIKVEEGNRKKPLTEEQFEGGAGSFQDFKSGKNYLSYSTVGNAGRSDHK